MVSEHPIAIAKNVANIATATSGKEKAFILEAL